MRKEQVLRWTGIWYTDVTKFKQEEFLKRTMKEDGKEIFYEEKINGGVGMFEYCSRIPSGLFR